MEPIVENIYADEAYDVLKKIEKSYAIKFGDDELSDIINLGELCDIVAMKVEGKNSADCTTQQAFYKLRKAIDEIVFINYEKLQINTPLADIFPKENRRKQVQILQTKLGFKVEILQPRIWIALVLILLFLVSLVWIFFNWKFGIAGLVVSLIGLFIAYKLGNEFKVVTLGNLAKKIARENYRSVRRNTTNVNRSEITKKVREMFIDELGIEENELNRTSKFI